MAEERRASKRLRLDIPIRYQLKGSQKYGRTMGRDISEGGIGFLSNEYFPKSTHLVFETRYPENQKFIKAVGEVVWSSKEPHSDRFFVGARFLGPTLPV